MLVDDEDYEWLMQWKWCAHKGKHALSCTFYARRSSPRGEGKRHPILMHREIAAAQFGEHVDHINHDTLDNRKENLRRCSASQNQHNARLRSDNPSGLKGVTWSDSHHAWQPQICCDGKPRYLGYAATHFEAALIYDAAAQELFGEFALLNFPEHAHVIRQQISLR